MISLETIVAMAVRNPVVMDTLGEALSSTLVLANPFLRAIATFAEEFYTKRNALPTSGDWDVWLSTLDEGLLRTGTTETLGRVLAARTEDYTADFFAEQVVGDLRRAAAAVARARLNEISTDDPELFLKLAEELNLIGQTRLEGLARLEDIDTWATTPRDDDLVGTGFPTLNDLMGGWGKELWIIFADSGVGKSILLQNFAVNAAIRGKNVLHVSLELGTRSQIHRYYRQIAEASRAEFNEDLDDVKKRLRRWFRFAKGSVGLLEFPAHSLTMEQLRGVIRRASRVIGQVDVLVTDYLDLMVGSKKSSRSGEYADLGYLTHEGRALCPQFDLTHLTASQSVRRPQNSNRLTLRDMGDSYNKVRAADGILALNQTDAEEEAYQGRLGVLKVRDSGGRGTEIPLYINRELAVIQELSHPNTVQLMRRLGHLPEQLAARAS
jgi:replicative DNA helicase